MHLRPAWSPATADSSCLGRAQPSVAIPAALVHQGAGRASAPSTKDAPTQRSSGGLAYRAVSQNGGGCVPARPPVTTAGDLASPVPPFLDVKEQRRSAVTTPFIVGVAGGTASGKTSVCQKIAEGLRSGLMDEQRFVLIEQDSFYRDLTDEEARDVARYNFDHPDAFAFGEMVNCLRALKRGEPVSIPMYDYKTNARKQEVTVVQRADVVLFDGILAFHDKELTSLMDLKLFVDVDSDTRLSRRIRRDIRRRGRGVLQVLDQYERTVKPSHDAFIYPSRAEADIIVPRGAENHAAIELVLQLLKSKLAARARGGAARLTGAA